MTIPAVVPRLPLFLCLLTASASVLAQTPPPTPYGIGDALKETRPPERPVPRQTPEPVIIQQDEKPLVLPEGKTLRVDGFRLEGAEFIDEAELQALLEPFKGRELSMAEIVAAADAVTALYRSRGYLVARAYVPRQDASGGILLLRIIVGRYGRFSLDNQSLVRDGLLQRLFDGLARDAAGEAEAVEREALERAMLLVNDMPGAQLPRLTISRGEAFGTSDFAVQVPAAPRFGGYLLGDNQGSRYTGKNRVSGGLDINSPFTLGDRITLNGLGSEAGGLENGRLAYAFPLAANGLRAELAASKTTYELGDDYKDLDATGTAYTLESTFSYPLIRTRENSLYLSLNLAAKRIRDEIEVVDLADSKRAKVGTLALRQDHYGSLFGFAGFTSLVGSLSYGRLDIRDDQQKAQNRAGADTVGDYARFNASALASLAFTDDLSGQLALSVQKALKGKNLDSSEQMFISGPGAVRVYRETVSGDNGYLLSGELRYRLPAPGALQHSLGVFFDLGRVYLEDADYALSNGVRLSDVGLGYQAGYKSLFGRLQVAQAVGSSPDEVDRDDDTRVLFQAGLVF